MEYFINQDIVISHPFENGCKSGKIINIDDNKITVETKCNEKIVCDTTDGYFDLYFYTKEEFEKSFDVDDDCCVEPQWECLGADGNAMINGIY